jgi:hypothetical protein
MADRNLSYYDLETNKWELNANKSTFTTDVMMGERTPAGTPLGSAQLSVSMAMSYFDQKREDIGLSIKELLYDYILPSFKATAKKEHIVRIAGQDLEKLNKLIVNTNIHNRFFQEILKTNRIPDSKLMYLLEEVEKERVNQGKEKQVNIEKGWYDDIKFDIDIEVTGESKDVRVVAANLLAALQMMSVNPNVLQDPTQRKIFAKYLEMGGIRLDDFEVQAKPSLNTVTPVTPAGGGVSASTNIGGNQNIETGKVL